MALSLGWGDPMKLLGLPAVEFQIAAAVIHLAQDLVNKRAKAELEYGAAATASKIVPPLGRAFGYLAKALARRG